MKLNYFNKKPFKIISYILLTFIGSYLTTMNFNVTLVATIISMWICLMPRLEIENYTFKDKIPKVIIKYDLVNNILKLVPIGLFLVFCKEESAISPPLPETNFNFLIYLIPVVVSCIHYIIYNKYKNEQDWAMPFFVSLIIVLGCQIITGDFVEYIKYIFPQFTDNIQPNITMAWLLLLQTAIVYAIYRLSSIIIASRSICIIFIGTLFSFFAYVQNLYVNNLGLDFKPNDIFKIKEFIALLSLMHKDDFDITKIIPVIAVVIAIGVFATVLSKKTSVYNFKVRAKSFLCGGLVVAVSFLMLNSTFKNIEFNNYETQYGFISYIVHNLNQKNTFNSELQAKIEAEIIEMEKATENKTEEKTEKNDDFADFTIPEEAPPVQQTVPQTTEEPWLPS